MWNAAGIALLCCFGCFPKPSSPAVAAENTAAGPVWKIDFQNTPPGPFSPDIIQHDWPRLDWAEFHNRAEIVQLNTEHNNRVLRVKYPAAGVGPRESGGQFLVPLPPADEYYLQYRIYFEPGFDFAKGGKLPGLTGGGSKATGGHPPRNGEGWSARYMWRREGAAVVYLYYPDQKGVYGEDQPLSVNFLPGRWYLLTQHIVINHPDRPDAVLEVWIDGKPVFRRDKFRLRVREFPQIDTFYFSTFFGGNSPDFAPKNDGYLRFDDFLLTRTPPAEILPPAPPPAGNPAP